HKNKLGPFQDHHFLPEGDIFHRSLGRVLREWFKKATNIIKRRQKWMFQHEETPKLPSKRYNVKPMRMSK
ncbi:MAG: hypothetical protein MJE68_19645, partial [Proteobacteria bacterium]|nr:hypothetical protein [Pseudomonadota bacterium]